MGKQQTAVEWFILTMSIRGLLPNQDIVKFYMQAKEMEKEQKIEFAKHCLNKALDLDTRTAYKNVEKYYNETYGKE